jgi:hypothetical protein
MYIVSRTLKGVSQREIDIAERKLGSKLPPTFTRFLLKYGEGSISGYIRPNSPRTIPKESKKCAEYIDDSYLEKLDISRDYARQLVMVADTIDGDMVFFHPEAVTTYLLFPRHHLEAFRINGTFDQLLTWIGEKGVIVQKFGGYYFQPWNDFCTLRFSGAFLSIEDAKAQFRSVARESFLIETEDCIDYFIEEFGAHLQYLEMRDKSYTQFIIHFDKACEKVFVPQLEAALARRAFSVTESHNVSSSNLRKLG